ncbi:MAG: hypothetical protein HQ501_00425 [Rhodospirillales bacterium]|nr:hypothetical protein [Rhodospirillales bacterium]
MTLTFRRIGQFIGQAIFYAGFAAFLGIFANSPPYARVPEGSALIKLSFAHGAKAKGGCRRLSKEELADLAANMRKLDVCPRERLPVYIRLVIDGEVMVDRNLPPSGLQSDGPSRMYERIILPSGAHEIMVSLRDTIREDGFDYESARSIVLEPGQSFAIDFHGGGDGFIFQ